MQVLGALDAEEVLTPLGRHLAQLPMEPRLGKLLVTATFMGCLSSALTIAACLSFKTPFQTAFQVRSLQRHSPCVYMVDQSVGRPG